MKIVGCLLLSILTVIGFAQERRQIRFGLVVDGPSPLFERDYFDLLKQEISTLLASDFDVSFDQAHILKSDFSLEQIAKNLDSLLADERVDIVICMGVLSTMEAASRGPFSKPVFAPFGIDPTLPLYPHQGDASGVHNFNYMVTPTSVPRDVALIQRLKPVKHIHMIVQDLFAQKIPEIRSYVDQAFGKHGITVTFILADQSAEAVLNALPRDTEMVYVTPLIRFEPKEKQTLFAGLATRHLLSFSMLGREEVEQGVLAGLAPKSDTLRWFRRVALNIQRALLGEDPATLPVLLKENSKLVFNMETARQIGWFPTWDLQITAELINEQQTANQAPLDLESSLRKALSTNPELAALERDLKAAATRIDIARSNLKPSISSSLTSLAVDKESAAASFGLQPETSTSGEIKLTQLIYSDGALAAVDIQRHLFEAAGHVYESARLDLVLEVAESYLDLLKARSLYQVRKENLDRTNSHLETARNRRDVGIASAAEVYRWDAQLANDKLEAISARNLSDQALYVLNRLIGQSQETPLNASVPDMMDPELRSSFGRIDKYVSNAQDFQRFRYFMVEESLRYSPELARIESLISAQKRKIQTDKRAYFLPTVALQGTTKYQFQRSSSDNPLLQILPPNSTANLPQSPDDSWNVALQFSLPLYNGGKRKQELNLDNLDLEHLELQRQSARDQVELRVRAGLQELATASVGIQLRREAAEAASKNLVLLEDAYAKGVASPIDLIDGQNAALIAEISAANAIHDYFSALMRFQRASGNFDYFISPDQREAFYQRLERYYKDAE